MRGAKTTKVVTLHGTLKTFTDRDAGYVDVLALEVVVCSDFFTNVDHVLGGNAEFGDFALWFHFCSGEMTAHRLGCAFNFGCACTELNSDIAVLFDCALGHNLQVFERKNGHRDLTTVFHEQTGHAHLFCDKSCAEHNGLLLYTEIWTSTPAARSSFISASTVCGVGSTMSRRRLCVRISN